MQRLHCSTFCPALLSHTNTTLLYPLSTHKHNLVTPLPSPPHTHTKDASTSCSTSCSAGHGHLPSWQQRGRTAVPACIVNPFHGLHSPTQLSIGSFEATDLCPRIYLAGSKWVHLLQCTVAARSTLSNPPNLQSAVGWQLERIPNSKIHKPALPPIRVQGCQRRQPCSSVGLFRQA